LTHAQAFELCVYHGPVLVGAAGIDLIAAGTRTATLTTDAP
jgi:hypothetical protein